MRKAKSVPRHMIASPRSSAEPLADGIQKAQPACWYLSREMTALLVRRRQELAGRGIKDSEIASIVSAETGLPKKKIFRKIVKMTAREEIGRNPNCTRREFSDEENKSIKRMRAEFAGQGLQDKTIARKLAGIFNRTQNTMAMKLQRWVDDGTLPPNQNKAPVIVYTEAELDTIFRRRAELIGLGYCDMRIAAILAGEISHSSSGIASLITKEVKRGRLPQNPHFRARTPQELIEYVKSRYRELIGREMLTSRIARIISNEAGKSTQCVRDIITRLVKAGELEVNPVSQRRQDSPGPTKPKKEPKPKKESRLRIPPEVIEYVKSRYRELIGREMLTSRIARIISNEAGKSTKCVRDIITRLVKAGELEVNPVSQRRQDSPGPTKPKKEPKPKKESRPYKEDDAIIPKRHRHTLSDREKESLTRLRNELMTKGLNDREIARRLTSSFERTTRAIAEFIRVLVRSGKLEENPNHYFVFTPEVVELMKKRRSEMIAQGLHESKICWSLDEELRSGNPKSIDAKIRKLVKSGEFEPNPNTQSFKFSDDEIRRLCNLYRSLVVQGLSDTEISEKISPGFFRTPSSMRQVLYTLRKRGDIEGNPNQQKKRLDHESVGKLTAFRQQLVREGFLDAEIGRLYAPKMGKNAHAVSEQIRKLVQAGKLPPNPNKMARKHGRERGFYQRLSDDELIDYALKVIESCQAKTSTQFKDADSGLHEALRKRNLLERLFSGAAADSRAKAIDDVLDALANFNSEPD